MSFASISLLEWANRAVFLSSSIANGIPHFTHPNVVLHPSTTSHPSTNSPPSRISAHEAEQSTAKLATGLPPHPRHIDLHYQQVLEPRRHRIFTQRVSPARSLQPARTADPPNPMPSHPIPSQLTQPSPLLSSPPSLFRSIYDQERKRRQGGCPAAISTEGNEKPGIANVPPSRICGLSTDRFGHRESRSGTI